MAKVNSAELAASLGFAAAFFNADPELQALIKAAVAGQWSTTKFQAAFMNTKWYRSRQASVRQWQDLITRDPTEANKKISDQKLVLSDMLTQFGVNVDDKTLTKLATESLQYAWSSAQLKNVAASMVNMSDMGNLGGTPATLEMQVQKLANDYGLNTTDAQLRDWVGGLLSEKYTQDNITDFLKDQAKLKYAGLSSQLDRGLTVRQAASPYLQSYSNILETDQDSIDLNDPLIQQALQGKRTDPTKPPTMQSVYDFEQSLRQDPRWLQTKNAHNDLTNAAIGIGRDWGLIA